MVRTQIQFPNPLPRRFVEEMAAGKSPFSLRGKVPVGISSSPRRPAVFQKTRTTTGFRHILDASLAFAHRYLGVTHFTTANEKHLRYLGSRRRGVLPSP